MRWLLFAAGVLLVGVGVVGILLPLLPSTIFFILAGACFARSSATAHRWLTTNRIFGTRLRAYHEKRGATLGTKVVTLTSLWLGIGFAAWVVGFEVWISVGLAAIAVAVSAHLLMLTTVSSTD